MSPPSGGRRDLYRPHMQVVCDPDGTPVARGVLLTYSRPSHAVQTGFAFAGDRIRSTSFDTAES